MISHVLLDTSCFGMLHCGVNTSLPLVRRLHVIRQHHMLLIAHVHVASISTYCMLITRITVDVSSALCNYLVVRRVVVHDSATHQELVLHVQAVLV
jgi:hypothetical protein